MERLLERDSELAELVGAVDAAREGRGGLILVSGEAGIGKTSLLQALRAVGRDRDHVLADAAALPEGGRGLTDALPDARLARRVGIGYELLDSRGAVSVNSLGLEGSLKRIGDRIRRAAPALRRTEQGSPPSRLRLDCRTSRAEEGSDDSEMLLAVRT
jgi:hypothetical protein